MDRATRREQRILHLEENVAKLRAEQNRLKGLTSQEERKRDTRWKILVGSMIKERVKKGAWSEKGLETAMDEFLERDRDPGDFWAAPPLGQRGEDGGVREGLGDLVSIQAAGVSIEAAKGGGRPQFRTQSSPP